MLRLHKYGWNEFHQQNLTSLKVKELIPGRVISIKGFRYTLITEKGEQEAELSGKLLFGNESDDLPKAGDWVAALDYGEMAYIIDVLPRMNCLSRKNPGSKTEKQILAANVDYAFIVQGLDRDFNIMRLERYLVQVTSCGITPIVVLNKSDVVSDPLDFVNEVNKLQRKCNVIACSTVTGDGLSELSACFEKCKTYILIGSSGVGKSSLVNFFMKGQVQTTGSTSEANSKGTHTTSTRDLFLLSNESLLMDTPGMREFGVTLDNDQGTEPLFPVIQELSLKCRFPDCTHHHEIGCAIQEALQQGVLELAIYESFVKLVKEQRRFQINAVDKKRLNKQFGKRTREAKNHRKKYKF